LPFYIGNEIKAQVGAMTPSKLRFSFVIARRPRWELPVPVSVLTPVSSVALVGYNRLSKTRHDRPPKTVFIKPKATSTIEALGVAFTLGK
jgi:hypothetical protein